MPVQFPPLELASPEGLLAVGGNLDEETIQEAYVNGIFPWPVSQEYPLTWFSPDPRGVLKLIDFRCSKSFFKWLKKTNFTYSFNQNFNEVIDHCAKVPRKDAGGTWINQDILNAYKKLFKKEKAYCVSVYSNGELVGGLYGVCFGEIISGESMFHLEDNASKFALYHLCEHLKRKGIEWIDTQMVTPIIESFGGKYIPRDQFISQLKQLDSNKSRGSIF